MSRGGPAQPGATGLGSKATASACLPFLWAPGFGRLLDAGDLSLPLRPRRDLPKLAFEPRFAEAWVATRSPSVWSRLSAGRDCKAFTNGEGLGGSRQDPPPGIKESCTAYADFEAAEAMSGLRVHEVEKS